MYEIPNDLKSDMNIEGFIFDPELQRVAFKDNLITMYPMDATDGKTHCYSFIIVPVTGRNKFNREEAERLGATDGLN